MKNRPLSYATPYPLFGRDSGRKHAGTLPKRSYETAPSLYLSRMCSPAIVIPAFLRDAGCDENSPRKPPNMKPIPQSDTLSDNCPICFQTSSKQPSGQKCCRDVAVPRSPNIHQSASFRAFAFSRYVHSDNRKLSHSKADRPATAIKTELPTHNHSRRQTGNVCKPPCSATEPNFSTIRTRCAVYPMLSRRHRQESKNRKRFPRPGQA